MSAEKGSMTEFESNSRRGSIDSGSDGSRSSNRLPGSKSLRWQDQQKQRQRHVRAALKSRAVTPQNSDHAFKLMDRLAEHLLIESPRRPVTFCIEHAFCVRIGEIADVKHVGVHVGVSVVTSSADVLICTMECSVKCCTY